MLCQGHRFSGGIKHFWMAVRMLKTNLVLEELARQKRTKMWPKWGLVRPDRRFTVRVIGSELNLNHQAVHGILTEEMGMQKICTKLVPKILTNEQKENRTNACLDLLERLENDENFFKHVITGDESWILEYDPATKWQSSEWHTSNSLHPKKARMSKSKIRSLLICFFDSQGIVCKEFMPQGQTVNKQYYHEVLARLRKRVYRVRPGIADTWVLHHNNTPCHTAISVNEYLTKNGNPVVPQPPYSPYLSPCDFFLFPKLKFNLNGRHFGTVDNIQKVMTEQLRAIPHEDFQHCYREWEQRLRRCVAFQGNYFEGDNVDL